MDYRSAGNYTCFDDYCGFRYWCYINLHFIVSTLFFFPENNLSKQTVLWPYLLHISFKVSSRFHIHPTILFYFSCLTWYCGVIEFLQMHHFNLSFFIWLLISYSHNHLNTLLQFFYSKWTSVSGLNFQMTLKRAKILELRIVSHYASFITPQRIVNHQNFNSATLVFKVLSNIKLELSKALIWWWKTLREENKPQKKHKMPLIAQGVSTISTLELIVFSLGLDDLANTSWACSAKFCDWKRNKRLVKTGLHGNKFGNVRGCILGVTCSGGTKGSFPRIP